MPLIGIFGSNWLIGFDYLGNDVEHIITNLLAPLVEAALRGLLVVAKVSNWFLEHEYRPSGDVHEFYIPFRFNAGVWKWVHAHLGARILIQATSNPSSAQR